MNMDKEFLPGSFRSNAQSVHVTVPLLPHAQSKCHTCRRSDFWTVNIMSDAQ